MSLTELARAAHVEHQKRMADERAAVGPRPQMSATLEMALTLREMEMLADLLNPVFEHRGRVSDLPTAHRLHEALTLAIRRQIFHEATRARPIPSRSLDSSDQQG